MAADRRPRVAMAACAKILHPWPESRFAVKHPRWEPYAGVPHVRFCAGALSNEALEKKSDGRILLLYERRRLGRPQHDFGVEQQPVRIQFPPQADMSQTVRRRASSASASSRLGKKDRPVRVQIAPLSPEATPKRRRATAAS